MEKTKKSLCATCQRGLKALRLDPKEPMCPYIHLHNGEECKGYTRKEEVANK